MNCVSFDSRLTLGNRGIISLKKHHKWAATLSNHLPELRINYTKINHNVLDQTRASLHQYGFALLSRDDGHISAELASADLQEISKQLGTLLPQSPRQELIEDIRDFSDVDD